MIPLAQLNCTSVEALAEGLRKCQDLSALDLDSNNIREKGAASLAKALAHCQSLNRLKLGYNKLGSEGAERLAGALGGCERLVHLDLSNIHAGSRGLCALGGLLELCSALRHLGLRGNGQDLDSEVHAVPASKKPAHIKHMDFARSPCTLVIFMQAVADHTRTLVHLDLEGVSMGFAGAYLLAMALDRCGKLEHLNLSDNDQLDDNAVRELTAGIGKCTALRDLNLQSCNVQPGGCSALAEALKGCTKLTRLNLRKNKIGPGGAFSLALALPDYTALANLDLSENNIRSSATRIARVLPECRALVHLNLGHCEVQATGRARLLEAAAACPNLSLHL